jgi:hypothetical protein
VKVALVISTLTLAYADSLQAAQTLHAHCTAGPAADISYRSYNRSRSRQYGVTALVILYHDATSRICRSPKNYKAHKPIHISTIRPSRTPEQAEMCFVDEVHETYLCKQFAFHVSVRDHLPRNPPMLNCSRDIDIRGRSRQAVPGHGQ